MIARDALLTDLYQLTMLQGYYRHAMTETAVFEFFVRKLPESRNFLVAAGLEQVLDFLENLRFSQAEIDWLSTTGYFKTDFLDYLAEMTFTGSVDAMLEGTVFFPNEPILRVIAPFPEAQLVESRVINLLHFQTLIASKAARSVLMAGDKLLVDFGFRRAHGAEAGVLAARASYLAGFSGTATVCAGRQFGIPLYGTMAHSFVQAHDDESDAFLRFAEANPDNVVLLIDTYDTEAGAKKVVALASKLQAAGIRIKGVRLDSGDLAEHAHNVRKILDEGGLRNVTIFASGGIDEYQLEAFRSRQAPIDGYGIGTYLDTSADAPYLDCAYKLQEYAGMPRRKRSEGKATWPGRKQVYRRFDLDGIMIGDTIAVEDEICDGKPLLQPVMKDGRQIAGMQRSLEHIRIETQDQLHTLPGNLKLLTREENYPIVISGALKHLAQRVDEGYS
ncbi:nicotinate phosphoribosyltransferase [Methylotuvimicrobium sp. KM2]|uniref:nicotinate phosphoribosyltransferase n=1 Tax=Methylotuvimicrobium sp. KM2 TaxID=3133976 RepID=UPI003100B89C